MMEGVKSINIVEDSSVDSGGCIIETDFGEIDARIASQLAELENRILEISPVKTNLGENTPLPVFKMPNLNTELAASTAIMDAIEKTSKNDEETATGSEEPELSTGASAALTASAALAALATMATKGKREVDKKISNQMDDFARRKTDSLIP
jgi:hypothetical protein